MKTVEDYRSVGQELYDKLRLETFPIAIKFIHDISEIPDEFTKPKDFSQIQHGRIKPSALGQKWSLCQSFTYARRFQASVAMTEEDNFCVPASYGHGWTDLSYEDLIQSQIMNEWRKDLESEMNVQMKFAKDFATKENMEKLKAHKGFIVSPLALTEQLPDTILIYGKPVQITHIIQALSYEGEHVITSIFNGFGESCIKGALKPFLTGKPQYVAPGMGDMTISGTQDYEVAVGLPGELLFYIQKNLFKTGGAFNGGMPVRTIPAGHLNEELLPGWVYLREKLNEKNSK